MHGRRYVGGVSEFLIWEEDAIAIEKQDAAEYARLMGTK